VNNQENAMKIGIVGAGAVGAAAAMAIVVGGRARELVIVNRNRHRARAIATDMRYGAPLSPVVDIWDGDYEDLASAKLVILTAGVNEKTGGATDRNDPQGRLRLLDANVKIFSEVVPRIAQSVPAAPIMVLTDPPEPLIDAARHFAGHEKVFGTSTFLDSLRFRVHLASRLGVAPASVDANVIGEHGTSSVFLWSSASVGGAPVREVLAARGISFNEFCAELEKEVRQANITIIEGIGASQYGVGMVAARMASMVLRDERAVCPAGAYTARYDVTLSLPRVIGCDGATEVIWPAMSKMEEHALERSADTIRKAVQGSLGSYLR
jgi:L-lactate dehydrogenase